ncbi:GumC family protein [Vibrio sinaloensis]|uniref:GumC family protein n=1 Tax=Photobacterium sp. (strain ATCC 43367) TaxID=379097 RepID=UPI0035EC28C8
MTVGMIKQGEQVESSIDFAPLLKGFKKHALKVMLFSAIVTGASAPLIMSMDSQYVSTSAVLLKAQADNATPFEQVEGFDSTRDQYYDTQFNLMQARVVLEKAIEQLELDENAEYNGDELLENGNWELSPRERLDNTVKYLRKHLTFTAVRSTQLVYVSFESPDPKEAARVANAVAQAFIDHSVAQKVKKTELAQDWNEAQMDEIRKQVDEKKAQIQKFLKEEGLLTFRGIDGFETEQLSITTSKLADAKERRLDAQAKYEVVMRNMNSSLEDVASVPEISNHPQLQDLRNSLVQAKRKLSNLQNKYGPKHNAIIEAKAEIEAVESQTKVLLDELSSGLKKQYQSYLSKENRYKALLNQQKAEFRGLVGKRDQYDTMELDLQKTEDLYQQLYLRSKEQELTAQYREPDALIYDPAVPAERPQKPNKKLLVAMVGVLSFILAVLFVIIRTATNQRVESLRQLSSKLGLAPLADMPVFDKGAERSSLVRGITRNHTAMETVHGLNSAIELSAPNASVIGVVSTCKQEGASFIAQLMAHGFASHHRTLLIDLDYRSESPLSKQEEFLAQPSKEHKGFAEWISEKGDIANYVMAMKQGGSFMPRGLSNQSPLVLLARPEAKSAMESLAQGYDRVIVNLPNLNENKEAQVIAKMLEGVVVVMTANRRSVNAVRQDIAKLDYEAINVLGGVLNSVSSDELKGEESLRFVAQGSVSALDSASA